MKGQRVSAALGALVNVKFTHNLSPVARREEFAVGEPDAVERTLDFCLPEIDKFEQPWMVGSNIIVLPDKGVEYTLVVGHTIEELSGRQSVALEHELGVGHSLCTCHGVPPSARCCFFVCYTLMILK